MSRAAPFAFDDREDDVDDRPRRKSPPPARRAVRATGGGGVWGMVVAAMVLGAGFAVVEAFSQPAPKAAVWAGLACCAGIFARMAQAELHQKANAH